LLCDTCGVNPLEVEETLTKCGFERVNKYNLDWVVMH